jgi:integrase
LIERRTTSAGQVRYEVRIRALDGRERSRTFRSKREAKDYEAAELAKRARGEWIDPRQSNIVFAEVAAEWLESNPAKRESTWVRDEVTLRLHLLPHFGPVPIGRIDRSSVQRWVNQHATTHAPRTVKRDYGVLQAVMAFALDRDLIGRTPCRGTRLPSAEPVDGHLINREELAALAEALASYGPMAYIGATLGLRWGEVAGLRVRRLDLLRNELTVAEQIIRGKGGVSFPGPPKSRAGRRTMTMPGWLTEILAEHLHQRGLTAADGDAWVFAWPSGAHLSYSAWRKHWLRATSAAGLPQGFGFHDLRRANATGLVSSGVDIRTAQSRLGHADVRMTLEIYARATNEADRAAADAIGRLFDPERIERPNVAHVARDGRGIEANRGIARDRRGMKSTGPPTRKKPQAGDLRLPWSGGGDLNSRPLRPERSALPS